MAALCGVVKVILSFFCHGEEGAVERHRSRLTVNFDEQRNISIVVKKGDGPARLPRACFSVFYSGLKI